MLRLDHLSARVVEHVLKYCFAFYLESYAVFQPLDGGGTASAAQQAAPSTALPMPSAASSSLDENLSTVISSSNKDDIIGGVDCFDDGGDLDTASSRYIQAVDAANATVSAADEDEAPFVLPDIAIHYTMPAQDAYSIFLAAHYLHIPPLLRLAAAYIAQFASQLDEAALAGLHPDLALEILQHLAPDALLAFERTHDGTLGLLGVDTTALWLRHIERARSELSANLSEFDAFEMTPLNVCC